MARGAGDRTHTAALAERMERDLSAIQHAMRRTLHAEVAKGELTGPQTAVMRTLLRQNAITVRELSREVSLAQSTVSGIVDRLEKRGMVERIPDAVDKRVVRIRTTAVVQTWVAEELPRLKIGPLLAALQAVEAEEREALAKAILRLRTLLTGQTEPAG